MLKTSVLNTSRLKIVIYPMLALVLVFGLGLSSCKSSGGGGVSGPSSSAPGSFTIMSQRDTDRDGRADLADPDDDNDSVPDVSDLDDDNDGISDDQEADSDDDGTIDDHDDDYVEVKGTVESVDDAGFVLFDYVIVVDDQTRYEGDHGQSFAFDDISVGMRLEVEGIWVDGETVLAREVELEDDFDDDDHGSHDDSHDDEDDDSDDHDNDHDDDDSDDGDGEEHDNNHRS